ncbi:MAG: EAL domain-containing response regulator [Acidobacteriaceae bacterium]
MLNGRFLILDDDPSVGQTIQWMAESLGYEARFVTRPQDFFQELEPWNPDFITIDLVMPELDGVEVLRILAERECRATIIITSGVGNRVLDAAKRSASQHGLDIGGILPKPMSIGSLQSLVEKRTVRKQPPVAACAIPESDEFPISHAELCQALERHEFVLAYQPKIECRSGALAGFEALVRWQHPERGVVAPGYFVPAMEGFGLIDVLSTQIFDQSLTWFSQTFLHTSLRLSLNLSARSLVDLRLADHLADQCSQFSIPTERVILELTETSAMVDPVVSLDLMTHFRVKGFHLSIDDFGTGYSSMIQLARLPFSEIKIDKSFVMMALQSQESRTITKSVVDLGHSLGLRVTAEGVEDAQTLEYLNSLGCDHAQGYFIARPMYGDDAALWAKRWPQQQPSFG